MYRELIGTYPWLGGVPYAEDALSPLKWARNDKERAELSAALKGLNDLTPQQFEEKFFIIYQEYLVHLKGFVRIAAIEKIQELRSTIK